MVAGPPLSIVFFGTPAFAAPTLEALLRSRHRVVGVVAQPDRPSGRGQKTSAGPVKALALAAGLPLLQPERLKEPGFLEAFAALRADIGVVAAYGRIIPEVLIHAPRLGLVNVHGSLLPRYRGAAPIQRAVMAGDTVTGITIMRIVKELDAGAMFARVVRPIPPDATSADVERDLAVAGARLLVQVVEDIASGDAREEPQDDALASYAPKITRDDSPIDWTRTARAIHDQVRGLIPWPRASTTLDGARLIVIRTAVEGGQAPATVDGASPPPSQGGQAPATVHGASPPPQRGLAPSGSSGACPPLPGTIVEAAGDVFRIATGGGVLRVLELQPEGRRVMTAREFLAGRAVRAGARLA